MKENKNIEEYTKKIVQEAGLDSPSSELMNNIMFAIEKQSISSRVYKPLISKNIWYVILVCAISFLLFVYLFLYQPSATILNVNALYDFIFPSQILVISMSKTMLYCFAFLSLFLIEIPFIKYFIERNFQY